VIARSCARSFIERVRSVKSWRIRGSGDGIRGHHTGSGDTIRNQGQLGARLGSQRIKRLNGPKSPASSTLIRHDGAIVPGITPGSPCLQSTTKRLPSSQFASREPQSQMLRPRSRRRHAASLPRHRATVGGPYGVALLANTIGRFRAVAKLGDYDGRLLLVDKSGAVVDLPGPAHYLAYGRFLVVEHHSDADGVMIYDVSLNPGDILPALPRCATSGA
jgi:hypothetical protein